MKIIKENMVFILLIAAVMLGLLVVMNTEYITSEPFCSEFYIDKPIGCCISDNGNKVIIDNSGSNILVTDSDMKLQFSIPAESKDEGYYQAVKAVTDRNNNIYVLDKIVVGNISTGRIVRFDEKGQFDCIVYSLPDEADAIALYGLDIYEDSLYCVEVRENEFITVKTDINTMASEEVNRNDFPDAGMSIADADVSPNAKTACVTKTGDVYLFDGEQKLLYNSGEHNVDGNLSLAYEIEYDSKGNLYIGDLGLRRVLKCDGKGAVTIILDTGDTSSESPSSMVEAPSCSGLCSFGTSSVSVISSEYYYDTESSESLFDYQLYVMDENGDNVFKGNQYEQTMSYSFLSIIVKLALFILAVILIISIIRFIKAARKIGSSLFYKIQILAFFVAVIVTFFVAMNISKNYNQRYVDEVVNKLENISDMTCQLINPDDVVSLDEPSDYLGDQYYSLSDTINGILYNDNNADSGLYCVVYKVINNAIWEVCSDPYYHGGFYPMAGSYEGSGEQKIYESGKPQVTYNYSSAAGSYMFSLSPIKSDSDEVVGLAEIGLDLSEFTEENNKLFANVLIYVIMGIIIVLLIIGELMNAKEAFSNMLQDRKANRRITVTMVRPIIFLIFFAANMSTAFLPIYGETLYTDSFPLPVEFAAAIPLSIEMLMAAITSLIAGILVEKIGARIVSLIGVAFYIGGMVVAAYADSLYILIGSNILIGIGGGLVLIAINSYIASYGDEKVRNKGFSCFNAALAAGANCGTVVGSLIAEKFGYKPAFLIGALIMVLSAVIVVMGLGRMKGEIEAVDESTPAERTDRISLIKFLTTPRVILFILFIMMPYLICASFLTYFFPVFGADNSLSEIQISLAFLLSGVIAIYIGPILSEIAVRKFGTKRSIILASVVYAVALIYFVMNPTIINCFIVIGFFSVADSFGLTAQDVYFSGIDEVLRYGSGKAMSAKSVFENIANVFGPIIFGAAMLYGIQTGLSLVAIVFIALLVIHSVFSVLDAKRNRI